MPKARRAFAGWILCNLILPIFRLLTLFKQFVRTLEKREMTQRSADGLSALKIKNSDLLNSASIFLEPKRPSRIGPLILNGELIDDESCDDLSLTETENGDEESNDDDGNDAPPQEERGDRFLLPMPPANDREFHKQTSLTIDTPLARRFRDQLVLPSSFAGSTSIPIPVLANGTNKRIKRSKTCALCGPTSDCEGGYNRKM